MVYVGTEWTHAVRRYCMSGHTLYVSTKWTHVVHTVGTEWAHAVGRNEVRFE